MKNTPVWWKWFPWFLGFFVIVMGLLGWTRDVEDVLQLFTLYGVFPLLGIWAWTVMWTHFIIGEARRLNPTLPKNHLYSKVSSYVVLICILLHPGLLAVARYQDGAGLPPGSLFSYVAKGSVWALMLGAIAFTLFLSFEVFDRLKDKPAIKKSWWFVNITQTVAMAFIFFHALELGSHMYGWFRAYWIALGIILIPIFIHMHWNDLKGR